LACAAGCAARMCGRTECNGHSVANARRSRRPSEPSAACGVMPALVAAYGVRALQACMSTRARARTHPRICSVLAEQHGRLAHIGAPALHPARPGGTAATAFEDWAHPSHIRPKTWLIPAASAPGLGSPLPDLGGLTPAPSAPGLGSA
jgi:hypothetical protein